MSKFTRYFITIFLMFALIFLDATLYDIIVKSEKKIEGVDIVIVTSLISMSGMVWVFLLALLYSVWKEVL